MILLAALALAGAANAQPRQPCVAEAGCATASAAQLFALADKLFQAGDYEAATGVLQALTHDKHPELRAEARFRLAAVREKMGDLAGAAGSLRELLAEQPGANRARLELARILSRMGDVAGSRAELARAEAGGLPPEVEQNVRRFGESLRTERRRGGSVELSLGPDSNVNRSTASPFVDTIIAPFTLDSDARQQRALGFSFNARGYSRDRLGGVSLLSNAGLRADLSTKPRFNDIQLALDSGPEARIGGIRLRPAALVEQRWYGGDPYSTGLGGSLELVAPLGARTQLGLSASEARQDISANRGQDGWRTALGADLTHRLGQGVTVRASIRYGALDACLRSESLRQSGGGLLLVKEGRGATLFGEVGYNRTRGLEPIFLFGKTRADDRWDVTAGAFFNRAAISGFTPFVRATHSDSSANIALYDYRRTRLDVGLSRAF